MVPKIIQVLGPTKPGSAPVYQWNRLGKATRMENQGIESKSLILACTHNRGQITIPPHKPTGLFCTQLS